MCAFGHFRFILNMWKFEKCPNWDYTLEILKIWEIFKFKLNSQNTPNLRNIQIQIKLSKHSKFEEIFKLKLNSQNTPNLRNIQIQIKLSTYSKFEKYSNSN